MYHTFVWGPKLGPIKMLSIEMNVANLGPLKSLDLWLKQMQNCIMVITSTPRIHRTMQKNQHPLKIFHNKNKNNDALGKGYHLE